MKKRVVSLMLTAVMLGSSVVSASAADFNVSDEAELLEQFTDESSADWSSEGGTSSDSVESPVGDGESDFDETPTETEEPTENVDNTEESKYNLTVNPNKSWVFFKNDLENLKISANEENFSEDNVLDDGSSEVTEEPEDITKKAERYNLDTTSLEMIKKDLPDDYSNYLNLENVIELLDKSETTYISGELVGAYVVPYDGYEVESVTLDGSLLTPYEGSVLYEAIMDSADSTLTVNTVEKAEEPEVDVVEDESTDEVDSSEGNISEEENTDDFTDENAVECTCGSSESNPYLHDWDCPVFQAKLVEDCDCSQSECDEVSNKLLKHDFDCTALLNAFNAICTCEVHDIAVMHDNCEVIKRIHSYICDCGKDYTSVDDIIDTHDENSDIVWYLMNWAEYANQPAVCGQVPGTKLWGGSAIPWEYASSYFDSGTATSISVSGATAHKSSGFGMYYYAKPGVTMTARMNGAGYRWNGSTRERVDVVVTGQMPSNFNGGFVFHVYNNNTALSINSGEYYTGKNTTGWHKVAMNFRFYRAGTNNEVSMHGTVQFTDIDIHEGYYVGNSSVTGVYTSSDSELKRDSKNTNWIMGTVNSQEDASKTYKKCLQITFNGPLYLDYRAGKDQYQRGTTVRKSTLRVHYELLGSHKPVNAPGNVYFASGGDTKTAVNSYNLTRPLSARGYTFNGWHTNTNLTGTYSGVSCETHDVNLYGKFTPISKVWRVSKQDVNGASIKNKDAKFEVQQAVAINASGWVTKWEKVGDLKYNSTTDTYDTPALTYSETNKGWFNIVETKAPSGYKANWMSGGTNICDTANNYTFTAKNEEDTCVFGTISITKVDKTTGKAITTATDGEFTIYEWNKDKGIYEDTCEATAKSFDSSESGNNKVTYMGFEKIYKSGNIYISDKNLGKFKVVETKNPTGYEGTWEQEFTLTRKVEPDSKSFTVENPSTVPQMGKIVVNKTIRKSDVHWAFGNPTFRFTVSGTDSQWNEKHTWHGYVEFKENMQADASGNLTLSYVIENVPIGTYEITEADTLSYKFESCKKVTSNVSEKGNYLVATLAYNKDSETVPTAEGTFSNSHLGYDQYRHTDVVENLVSTEWK